MNHPGIVGIGTATPPVRLTQEQRFHATGYESERIRKIFLNGDIDFRHLYLEGGLNRNESSDELNQRYLRGAMHTGCRAILNCLKSSNSSTQDIDFSLPFAHAPATSVLTWAVVSLRTWVSTVMFKELPLSGWGAPVPFPLFNA